LSPKYIVYQNQSIAEIVEAFKFPLLIKQDLSWSGVGIFKCYNETELSDTLHKIQAKENLVVQEFIDGEDVGVEALYKDGALVAFITSKVLTYMGNAFSVSTRRIYYRDNTLEKLLQELGEAFGINGFVNIAYMLEKHTGKYYLIEVDFRLNSWFAYGRFIGCDFSEAVNRYLDKDFNAHVHKPMLNAEQPIEVALFFKDLRRTIIKKTYVDFADWIFNRKGYWKFIPKDRKLLKKIYLDLKPMIVKRILRKKYTDMK